MSTALINASPKKAKSASGILLDELKGLLPASHNIKTLSIHSPSISEADVEELHQFDAWVFAFPLYVDAVPSHLLSALRHIEKNRSTDKGITEKDICVYAIVNLGFYEGKQARNALALLENWCLKSKLKWCGGIGFGGGAALIGMENIPLGRGPKTSLGKSLSALSEAVLSNSTLENIYASIDFPRFLYKFMAETGWRSMIKANGGSRKDLNKRL